MSDSRGLRLGTPCQSEHTINSDGQRFRITCGDEVLVEVTLHRTDEPQRWAEGVMLRHEIDCWKALVREAREAVDPEGDWEHLTDRIDAALREGKFADV